MVPCYIKNNSGFYLMIAEEFHRVTRGARTKAAFEEELEFICRRYRRELTNEEVLSYLMECGKLGAEDVQKIRNYYLANLGPLQSAILGAGMQEGKKYSLVYLNEFGFPVAEKITFFSAAPRQYAQFEDAVRLTYKRKGGRNTLERFVYNGSIAIYDGWKDLPDIRHEEIGRAGTVSVYRSKYTCFDSRYFLEAVEALGKPLVEYRDFKAGVDGKIYA